MKTESQKRHHHAAVSFFVCLMLAFCSVLPGCASKNEIRIGTSSAMQDQIIAWMLCKLALKDGLEAEVRTVSDGIVDLQPALESGSLQAGVEYAQSAWKTVLKEKKTYTPADLTALQREYAKKQLSWVSLPMVSDHYTLAVSRQTAAKYHLQTLSDLAKVSDKLILGAPTSFLDREEGYPWLLQSYEMDFATTTNLPEDKLLEALRAGKIDVIPVHSLDGNLLRSAVVVLEDIKDVYHDSVAGIVFNQEALMAHPELMQMAKDIGRVLNADQLSFYARLAARQVCTPEDAALTLLKSSDLIIEEQSV